MAGTFTSDLVRVQAAEDTANYIAVGTLKATLAANDDYKVEGTNCLTFGVSSTTGTGTYHLGAKDLGISAAVVSAGGSGYTVGDRLTVVGGTGIAGVLTVATLSGSAVATVTVSALDAGSYTVVPTNPVSVTGGTGTSATFNLTTGGLNLTGQGLHVFTWIKGIAWPSMATKAAGGAGIIISSDTAPTAVQSVLSATVVAGGTAYTLNDELTVSGGVGTAAVLIVTGVSGGVVTAVTPKATARGSYTTFPTNPVSVTGGTGSSATFNLTSIRAITNTAQWFVGGSNTNNYEGWVPYVVDIDGTPDLITGTAALTSVDLIGLRSTATAVSKLTDVITDINYYGTGSTITAGTGSTPVTLADYQAYDNATTRAWGVVIQQEGIYFVGGKLNIGTTTQSAETVFKDQSLTVVYHDFPVASGFYGIIVVGASGQKTTLQLGAYTPASGLTSNGATIKGAGNITGTSRTDGVQGLAHSIWKLTASDANQVTKLYSCNFSEMLSAALAYNAVSIEMTTNCSTTNASPTLGTSGSFDTSGIVIGMKITGTNIPADTYVSSIQSATSLTMNKNATGTGSSLTMTFIHNNEVRGCTFSNFGAITTNGCVIDNCTFQDVKTGAPISATWALIVDSVAGGNRITNCKFINCNRAIKITAAGTYTFDNLTFSGNTYDIENSSTGLVTINLTNSSNASTYINTGGGTTNIVLSVTVALTVVNESSTAVQGAQVYFQKSAAGKTWNYTSDAGNNATDADFIVNEVVDLDIPQTGWLHVWDASSNTKQNYRYTSWSGKTFNLLANLTGMADAGGSTTTLIDAAGNFTGINIQEGDTIVNTSDTPDSWAVVDEIVSATELTTSALQGGAANTWAAGNTYSFHRLAIDYTDNEDLVDIPIFNGQTNASGQISTPYNYSAYSTSLPVTIRIRTNTPGSTNYIPLTTSGTITSSGYSGTVVLTQDTVAT